MVRRSFRPSTLHVLLFTWCCALYRQCRCERHCGDSWKPKLCSVPPTLRILSRLSGPVSAVPCRMMLSSPPSSYCGKLFWNYVYQHINQVSPYPTLIKPKEKGAGGIAIRASASLECLEWQCSIRSTAYKIQSPFFKKVDQAYYFLCQEIVRLNSR